MLLVLLIMVLHNPLTANCFTNVLLVLSANGKTKPVNHRSFDALMVFLMAQGQGRIGSP